MSGVQFLVLLVLVLVLRVLLVLLKNEIKASTSVSKPLLP